MGIDHSAVLDNLWLVVGISLGGGGFVGQVIGAVSGDIGFLTKLVIAAGTAGIFFASIWFLAPASAV